MWQNTISYSYFYQPDVINPVYFAVIQLMWKRSVEDLLSTVNVTAPEAGKALVQYSFEDNNEVVETAHTVPLLDIFGRTKIKYPCRSTYCRHINVFDLKIWLALNEKEKKMDLSDL